MLIPTKSHVAAWQTVRHVWFCPLVDDGDWLWRLELCVAIGNVFTVGKRSGISVLWAMWAEEPERAAHKVQPIGEFPNWFQRRLRAKSSRMETVRQKQRRMTLELSLLNLWLPCLYWIALICLGSINSKVCLWKDVGITMRFAKLASIAVLLFELVAFLVRSWHFEDPFHFGSDSLWFCTGEQQGCGGLVEGDDENFCCPPQQTAAHGNNPETRTHMASASLRSDPNSFHKEWCSGQGWK